MYITLEFSKISLIMAFLVCCMSTTSSAETLPPQKHNELIDPSSREMRYVEVVKPVPPVRPASQDPCDISIRTPPPNTQCDATTCRCKDPGKVLGGSSFDENELLNYESNNETIWHAANFDMPDQSFRSDPETKNVILQGGELTLRITEKAGKYSSAEIRTQNNWYGYGCVSACMKPSGVSGIISSLFTYTDQHDGINGSSPNHNEIDVQFEGHQQSRVQFNYYVDRAPLETQQNEYHYELGYDATQSFNVYGFKWTPWGIEWYVNGANAYTINNEGGTKTPIVEEITVQKVMANLWVVSKGIENNFGGKFNETGFHGAESQYKWIRYEKLDEFGCCQIAAQC